MTRGAPLVTGTLLGVALIVAAATVHSPPLLVWNATASAPVGLYWIGPAHRFAVGDLIIVTTPPTLAPLFADRGYLPIGVPLLKHVAALSGAVVCRLGERLTIEGIAVAAALDRDHEGRSLPHWQGCHRLGDNEVFLLNTERPDSLDGRYFGPVPAALIIGRAEPLWTWTGG
jgi:conjugative transfer signal peptidase TraF